MRIRIGSRKSDLAQIQARLVAEELRRCQRVEEAPLEFEFVFKDLGVDLDLNLSLVEAESKGLFTKDLSVELAKGNIDLVVHSWKDLPTAERPDTMIAATLTREDPRDVVFVSKNALSSSSLDILSSSPRREFNIGEFFDSYAFPGRSFRFLPVRGNLPTRMRRFLSGEADALVLALAAIKRLSVHGNEDSKKILRQLLTKSLPLVVPIHINPPAPAQGALAIEVRRDRADLIDLLSRINCSDTFREVSRERERLMDFGGGCHLKLGIYHRCGKLGTLHVEQGLSPDGRRLRLRTWTPLRPLPENLKQLKFFDASSLNLFDRVEIPKERPEGRYLFVISRANALPSNWCTDDDMLWVSGLKTWSKCQSKGHWIAGSYEGLGEKFFDFPSFLFPDRKQLKLSHDQSPGTLFEGQTYRLKRNGTRIPDLSHFEYFFWPSSSLFLECLKEYPHLREKIHFCGLGNSYREISQHVPAARIWALLSPEDDLPLT